VNTIKISLLFGATLAVMTCNRVETTDKFADYLQEEKKMRERVIDLQELEDSLTALQDRMETDPDQEISRLQAEPEDWITLLRKLKSAR
jgi:hypothetical protein